MVGAPDEDPWYSRARAARLKVIEAFRGIPKDTREIDITLSFLSACRAEPVHPRKADTRFHTFEEGARSLRDGGCTQSVSSNGSPKNLQQSASISAAK